MSAANFCTMRDFPLFAKDYYEEAKRCPECGAIMDADAVSCEDCGCEELEVPHPVADVLIPVDSEMLKWLDMKQFPEDSQELVDAIKEAVYLAYKRV